MDRPISYVEGWAAIEWVGGTGAGLLLTAGVLLLRARTFHDRPDELATYRSAGSKGSHRGENARVLAYVLIGLCVVTQLFYVGLYIELVQWLLGAKQRPRLVFGLFFFVLVTAATSAGAALYTGWKKLED